MIAVHASVSVAAPFEVKFILLMFKRRMETHNCDIQVNGNSSQTRPIYYVWPEITSDFDSIPACNLLWCTCCACIWFLIASSESWYWKEKQRWKWEGWKCFASLNIYLLSRWEGFEIAVTASCWETSICSQTRSWASRYQVINYYQSKSNFP